MRVSVTDGRQIVGRFMAFDRHMNLVLGDAEEFRKLPPKKGMSEEDRETRRVLGLVILRGDEVIDLTIEGPPPADESRIAKGQVAPGGPGLGRAAGRGMPAPAPGAAPAGLAGPARACTSGDGAEAWSPGAWHGWSACWDAARHAASGYAAAYGPSSRDAATWHAAHGLPTPAWDGAAAIHGPSPRLPPASWCTSPR
ncbi:hypothetical protein N2152v2_008975 [Parachlorella kessleri]